MTIPTSNNCQNSRRQRMLPTAADPAGAFRLGDFFLTGDFLDALMGRQYIAAAARRPRHNRGTP